MTITLEEFRAFFCDQTTAEKRSGTNIYYGSSYGLDLMGVLKRIPPGFQVAWGWCDEPYRMVWIDFREHAIITFCEGDVDMSIAPDNEAFTQDRITCRIFYGKPRNMDGDLLRSNGTLHLSDPEGEVMAEDESLFERTQE